MADIFALAETRLQASEPVSACQELARALIDLTGRQLEIQEAVLGQIRAFAREHGLPGKAILVVADRLSQARKILSVRSYLEYEEMMLVVTNISSAFAVQRFADVIGEAVGICTPADLEMVRGIASGSQEALYSRAVTSARSRSFLPMPLLK